MIEVVKNDAADNSKCKVDCILTWVSSCLWTINLDFIDTETFKVLYHLQAVNVFSALYMRFSKGFMKCCTQKKDTWPWKF